MGGGTGPTPEHLALAEADGIQVLTLQLEDESTVEDIQQLVGVEALLVTGDVLGAGEPHLLQAHRAKEFHLLLGGLQLAIEEPASLWVADGKGIGWPPPVLELDLQVCHCGVEGQATPSMSPIPVLQPGNKPNLISSLTSSYPTPRGLAYMLYSLFHHPPPSLPALPQPSALHPPTPPTQHTRVPYKAACGG